MSLDIYLVETKPKDVYHANYTHNCGPMAQEAGLYKYVWRPEECPDIKKAADLIPHLTRGIQNMKDEPERFIALNPENGWGSYDGFLSFLESYLMACEANPNAEIEASR